MEQIISRFRDFKVDIDNTKANLLQVFFKELISYNEHVNLTAITDYDEVIIKHFLDSASILKSDLRFVGKSIIDVGTGAGFPGIVLSILLPETDITLLETLNKRCIFLDYIVTKLGLDNVKVYNGRAEDFGKNIEFREKFDYSLSRAVANLNSLSEYLLPFVNLDGYMVSYKGKDVQNELILSDFAIKELGGEFDREFLYELPDGQGKRSLVIVKKIKTTPDKFPRKAGIPTKRPLA